MNKCHFFGFIWAENNLIIFVQTNMSLIARQKTFNSSKTYSNKSYKTNQDSKVYCSVCKTSREDLQSQVAQFKDKAHQSFMQVLQIQQLHDEELQQLREEFQQKQGSYVKDIEQLKQEVQKLRLQLGMYQKNMRRHSYDFGARQLVIENIDEIICQQGQASYLDESELIQFKDLISLKNGNDYVQSLRKEIYRDFKFISNNKTQIQKMFIIIRELKDQNIAMNLKNDDLSKRLAEAQGQLKHLRNNVQNMNKQSKFLSQHLKRLGNDKLKLQKRVTDLQKHRFVDESIGSPNSKDLLNTHTGVTYSRFAPTKSLSPTINREVKEQIEHQKQLSSILQVSKCSFSDLCESKREINQLNYAKFMVIQEIQSSGDKGLNFKKRKSLIGKQV